MRRTREELVSRYHPVPFVCVCVCAMPYHLIHCPMPLHGLAYQRSHSHSMRHVDVRFKVKSQRNSVIRLMQTHPKNGNRNTTASSIIAS